MPRLLQLLALLIALASPGTAQTCTTSWLPESVGPDPDDVVWTDGSWQNAARWSGGVPGPDDVACINGPDDRSSSFVVSSGAPVEVRGLVVRDGLNTSNGSADDNVTVNAGASLILNGPSLVGDLNVLNGNVLVRDTLRLRDARLAQAGGVVLVQFGAVLEVAPSDRRLSQIGSPGDADSDSQLRNFGEVLIRERVNVFSPYTQDVTGRVRMVADPRTPEDDVARFDGDGVVRDASFEIEEGASLLFGGQYTVGDILASVVDGVLAFTRRGLGDPQGSLTFEAGAELNVFGANGLALRVPQSGAASDYVITAEGGSVQNNGLLRFPGTQRFFQNVQLINFGTLRLEDGGDVYLQQGSSIQNTGTFVLDGSGNNFVYGNSTSDPGTARVVVRGQLVKENENAFDALYVPVDVLNGEIDVRAGRLDVRGGGTLQNPSLKGSAGAELQLFGAWDVEGTVSGQSAATPTPFEDDVSVVFAGSNSTPTTFRAIGEVVFDVDGAGIELGVSTATTTLTAGPGGRFVNRSPLLQKGFTDLRDVDLRNEDEVSGGGFRFEEGGRFVNAPGATASLRSGVFADDGTGAFVNEGLVRSYQNGSNITFRGILDSRPGSELRVGQQAGPAQETINLSQEDPASYGASVTLSGDGRFSYAFGTRLQGTISPGRPEAPFDTLGLPDLQFSETEGEPRFVVDVGDGISDFVATGDAGILDPGGATLVVRIAPGFVPAPGDEWVVARRFRDNPPPTPLFDAVEVEGAPEGVAFVQVPDVPGAIVARAAVPVAIAPRDEAIAEGAAGSFVLTHPASDEGFSVPLQTGGSAAPFADYTLGVAGGAARVLPNTTQTVVPVYARRDTDGDKGPETVTLRVLTGGGAAPAPGQEQAALTLTDGPSSDALALGGVFPNAATNAGTFTPTVIGQGFGANATVTLVGPSTVGGTGAVVAPEGDGVQATFSLQGAPTGVYDVVVSSGGQEATLAGAVTVSAATPEAPPLWVSVSGTPAPRRNRTSTYTVTVGNDAPYDVYDSFVLIRVTQGLEFEIDGLREEADPVPEVAGLDRIPTDGATLVPVYVYKLPAGESLSARVRVRAVAPIGTGDEIGVAAELYGPNPEAAFTYSGDFDDAVADRDADRWTVWTTIWGALEFILAEDDPERAASGAALTGALRQMAGDPCQKSTARPGLDPNDPNSDEFFRGYSTNRRYHQYAPEIELNTPNPTAEFIGYSMGTFLLGAAVVIGSVPVGVTLIIGSGVLGLSSLYFAGQSLDRIENAFEEDCGGGTVGGSFDPNDKLGPAGVAELRYYDPQLGSAPYTIRFENVDTATFPAQEVVIVDTLDAAVYDLSTFALGPIRWGEDREVLPPRGAQTFEAEVDLAPEIDATLLITAALDRKTGRAVWRFATLDPETFDLPEDGTVGFLPPNVMQPEGEGSVGFTVDALPGLPTGTEVRNQAEIVFDVNAPIVTPAWTNTVDVTAPATAAASASDTNPVLVQVEGGDLGAGVGRYVLYASQDGGPFEPVATTQAPPFELELDEGSTYGFYTRALDLVGNAEGPKTEAEVVTTIRVDAAAGPDLPAVLTLEPPRPNPASRGAAFRYGLPTGGSARLDVFDLIGRRVATLADGEQPAGWHEARLTRALAPGLYVVRLRADGAERTQKVTVVR